MYVLNGWPQTNIVEYFLWNITASKENVVVFFRFQYAEFGGYVHFFRSRPQIPFLGTKKSKLSVYFKIWYMD